MKLAQGCVDYNIAIYAMVTGHTSFGVLNGAGKLELGNPPTMMNHSGWFTPVNENQAMMMVQPCS
jgi:hypothetical protein